MSNTQTTSHESRASIAVLLFIIAAIFAALSGLKRPSQDAILPRLVSHDDLPSASALMSLRWQFGGIVGPSAGGIIVAAHGAGAGYFVDCCTFIASLALLWQVRSVRTLPLGKMRSVRCGVARSGGAGPGLVRQGKVRLP